MRLFSNLIIFLTVALLVGCEVKDKMVIQYGDYEETVLAERVESELGFVMDMIHGVEYQEDLDARTFEIVEPYSLSITVRDDVRDIYSLYEQISSQYQHPSNGRLLNDYHPMSARLSNFDLFLLGDTHSEAIFYFLKEAYETYYIIYFTLDKALVESFFPEIRAMLASFEIPGYTDKLAYDDSYIKIYRGFDSDIVINTFKYYEEDKVKSIYNDLQSKIGDPSTPYMDISEQYIDLLQNKLNLTPPTGNLFNRRTVHGGHDNDFEENLVTYYFYMPNRPNQEIHIFFYEAPKDIIVHFTIASFFEGLIDFKVLLEEEFDIDDQSSFQFDYGDEEDIYYFICAKILNDQEEVVDSFYDVVYVPTQEIHAELSLVHDTISTGEVLELHLYNAGPISIDRSNDYRIEKYEQGEWWWIPFDGYSNYYMYADTNEKIIVPNIKTDGLGPGKYRIVQEMTYQDSEWITNDFSLAVPFTILEE